MIRGHVHDHTVHTTREHGPSLRAIFTGVKSVAREHGTSIWVSKMTPVSTGGLTARPHCRGLPTGSVNRALVSINALVLFNEITLRQAWLVSK